MKERASEIDTERRKSSVSMNQSFEDRKKKEKSFFGGMASGFRKIFGAKDKVTPLSNVKLEEDAHYESGRKNIIF